MPDGQVTEITSGISASELEFAISEAQAFNASVADAVSQINAAMVAAKQQILFERGIAVLQVRNAQWDAIAAIRAEAGASSMGADGAALGANDPSRQGYSSDRKEIGPR
jgi:hypothetical protein